MINRDLIRRKIVQLTYAYYQNGNRNMDNAEKELFFSLSKAYDLYNYQLQLIVEVTKEARKHYDLEVARVQREGGDAPSQKFAFNRFAVQLEENKMLGEWIENKNSSWDDDIEVVRRVYAAVVESDVYQQYMNSEEDSYDADREVWRRLYKNIVMDNEDIEALLEEKSLYWNDDKDIIDTFVLKTIKRFDPANKDKQELLPEYRDMEDREFARKLFRATILNADEYQKYMARVSRNWDLSRLAYMDMVIMQIAIAELVNFPGIPASVTINEYVELSKFYSTPRSGGYVNGMLDSIARSLIESGVIMKELPERLRREQNVQRRSARGGFGVQGEGRGGQQRRQRIGQPRYYDNGNGWKNGNNGYPYDQPTYDRPSSYYDQPAEPTLDGNATLSKKSMGRMQNDVER